MSGKHTPGPWSRSNPRGLTIDGPPDRTGWVLTVAHVADRPDEKQALADACLIAAAPDLARALADLLADALSMGLDDSPVSGSLIEARKALRKAGVL